MAKRTRKYDDCSCSRGGSAMFCECREGTIPKAVASDDPVEVEHGEQLWRMPSGGAAVHAAVAIDGGEDVEAKLAALGGERLA